MFRFACRLGCFIVLVLITFWVCALGRLGFFSCLLVSYTVFNVLVMVFCCALKLVGVFPCVLC